MILFRLFIVSVLALSVSLSAAATEIFTNGNRIEVFSDSLVEAEQYSVQVVAPDGRIWQEIFHHQPIAEIDLATAFSGHLPDGQYSFEIQPHAAARATIAPDELRGLEAISRAVPDVVIGTVTMENGVLVDPNQAETKSEPLKFSEASPSGTTDEDTDRDFVINDDLIVTGSACIGFDCINNETFSFDTVKLKENNLRLTFIDTSTVSGFPAGDWQLRANDSASGGADFFSIDWLGTSANIGTSPVSTPFRVDGSAPTNAIRVGSTGRIGFRTSNPVLDLHVATGNTPGLRLEQNSSSGFTAQTWDIAGNEANFFIRDVTSGSRLPFRIRPGAPTSSIDIAASGNVGIGTATPGAPLHVRRTNSSARLTIEDTGLTDSFQILLALVNNGNPQLRFENTDTNVVWNFRTNEDQCVSASDCFIINRRSGPRFRFEANGDMVIDGSYEISSSRTTKQDLTPLDPTALLASLSQISISEWSYTANPETRRIGPMAEDFYAAFRTGSGEQRISPSDMAGVALAAAQALLQEQQSFRDENETLRLRIDQLERYIQDNP